MAKQEKTASELEKIVRERYGRPVTVSVWGPGDGSFDITVTANVGSNIMAAQAEINAIAAKLNGEYSLKVDS